MQVKIWFQNKRSKEKKFKRQHNGSRPSNEEVGFDGHDEEAYSDEDSSSTSTNNNDSSLHATSSLQPACESKDVDVNTTTTPTPTTTGSIDQIMIKSSPLIYEQSSPPSSSSSALMSSAVYSTHDFLRSNSMPFDYGPMSGFWPPHLYDTNNNNNNTSGYYQQHPAPIHS